MFTIGLDIGSVAAKGVIFDGEKIAAWDVTPTGWSPREAARGLYDALLEKAGLPADIIDNIVATGYGRVTVDFAGKKVTEITCHAAGAHFFLPENRLIIDIGGQDSKAILINDRGKVLNFVMNDKCAAGTGRFLQVMAATLGLEMEELNTLNTSRAVAVNSMCTVFAESEVVSLLAAGTAKEEIMAGLFAAIARRTVGMAAALGSHEGVTFTGGVARINGVREALARALETGVQVPELPQLTGALGAAIIAAGEKGRAK